MSYDVGIGDDSFNYTSNVSALFYDHIPDTGKGGGLRELDGLYGADAVDVLKLAFKRINNTRHRLYSEGAKGEPRMCAKYDAQNGWGSTVGAIIFLAEIMAACASNPHDTVGVSS